MNIQDLVIMAAAMGPLVSWGLERTFGRWLSGAKMQAVAYVAAFGVPLAAWVLAWNGIVIPGSEALAKLPYDVHGLLGVLVVGAMVAFGSSLTNALVKQHATGMKV